MRRCVETAAWKWPLRWRPSHADLLAVAYTLLELLLSLGSIAKRRMDDDKEERSHIDDAPRFLKRDF